MRGSLRTEGAATHRWDVVVCSDVPSARVRRDVPKVVHDTEARGLLIVRSGGKL